MLNALRMPRFKLGLVAMPARALAIPFVLAAAFVSAPARATGPAIGFSLPNPTRVYPDGSPAPSRDLGRNSNGISFDDCEKDISLVFDLTFTLTGATTDQLQVWVGTDDCTTTNARSPATNGTCQPVTVPVPISATTLQVKIRARDLAAINGQASPGSGGGAFGGFTTATDDKSCFVQQASAGRAFNIAFLEFVPGQNDADGSKVFQPATPQLGIVVDTVGPQAPGSGGVDVGDTLLKVHWNPSADISDTFGFRVFCDPPPGKQLGAGPHPEGGTTSPAPTCTAAPQPPAPTVDSGVDTGAAVDAAINDASASDAADAADAADTGQPTVDSGSVAVDSGLVCTTPDAGIASCGTNILQNGVNGSSIDSYYVCADIGDKSATQTVVTGLSNGVVYTFAGSAEDASGNAGPTTIIACKAPAQINDFFDIYRSSGGLAGGGFCTLDSPGAPFGTSVFGIGVMWIAAALVRRRRTK